MIDRVEITANTAPAEAEISTAEASNITLYKKVREKFGGLLKSPVSRRVALATSAVVLPVMAAACGGGAKSATTPEGGVAGAAVQPGGGSSPIVVKTEAMPSATAKVEVPTATAKASEVLTPQQLLEAGTQINGLFTQAFEGLDISVIASKIPQPSERDPQYIQNAINICTGAAPFPYRDAAEKQRMDQNPALMFTGISNFCGVAGETSLAFYNALGDNPAKQAQFKEVNMRVETLHHDVIKGFENKDSRITEGTWLTIKSQYYPFGATGTSN